MPDVAALRKRALNAIDHRREALFDLSRAIHAKPETAYEEREASARIAEFLEKNGFKVERGYKGIETSYRGDAAGKSGGPRVAILAEYDALAELGHGCGHNLIAMIGTGAAIAVREVIGDIEGAVAAIGTPAEEGGGGKVALLRAGGFDDVDAAMMIQLFNSVNAMRQQLRSDARIHGIITNGGSAANVIPDHTAGRFSVRALDRRYQQEVLKRFIACAEGAATATGTKVKVTVHENAGYENMVFSTPMAERWTQHMKGLGMQVFEARDDERVGSTDMGNVMQVMPAIHPYIAIAQEPVPGHSIAFRDLAVTQGALDNALIAAKALALTALDVLTDPAVLQRARAEFEERRKVGVVKGRAS